MDSGPYAAVRHPGYTGGLIFTLGTPLMLGALWAMIPAVLVFAVTVLRTSLEDDNLHRDLPGYAEYARRVRYRLLPGV